MVGNSEQHLASRSLHSLHRVPLLHEAIPRRHPGDGHRHLSRAFDLGQHFRRDIEVLQATPRALEDQGPSAAARATRLVDDAQILRARSGDLGRINPNQRLALAHMVARGDVLDLIDERVGPKRDNGNAAFIKLDRTWSPDWAADHPSPHRFRAHAGALQLAGRDRDGVALLGRALVDGDVVHPHRVLLRRGRGVGQAHRVAVIEHPPAAALSDRLRG